jgi:hypothetical protein
MTLLYNNETPNYDFSEDEVIEQSFENDEIQFSEEDEAAYQYYEQMNSGTTRQQYNHKILLPRSNTRETKNNVDDFEDAPDIIEDDGLTHEERRLEELKLNYIDEGYDDYTSEILAEKDLKIEALENKQKPIVLSAEDEAAYKYYEKRNPGTTRKQYYHRVVKPRMEFGM